MYAAINPNEPLSEVVAVASNAEDLFEEAGIDYWFGWKQPLREACAAAHVAPADVAFRLQARENGATEETTHSLVALLSGLDQHFDLRLAPALERACGTAAKLGMEAGARCLGTLECIERIIRTHVATARRTLSPVAAALDVGAAAKLDEKVMRHLAMEHSILALRASDLREQAERLEGTEFDTAARALIREVHQHIKISYNFILPRLVDATRPAPGYEAW